MAPDVPRHPLARQGRRAIGSAVAVIVVGLLAGSVVMASGFTDARRSAPHADDGMVDAKDLVSTARAFLAAYGDRDADRAIEHLARDARIAPLIGSDGGAGTTEQLRLHLALLDAWRYRHDVTSCLVTDPSADGAVVRCSFAYDLLGSEHLGSGPYTGSSFDLTIADGHVVSMSTSWALDRFAQEVWRPFASWVSRVHPKDAERMYDDSTFPGVRLDTRSIRLWERHTGGYLWARLERSLIGDLHAWDAP